MWNHAKQIACVAERGVCTIWCVDNGKVYLQITVKYIPPSGTTTPGQPREHAAQYIF